MQAGTVGEFIRLLTAGKFYSLSRGLLEPIPGHTQFTHTYRGNIESAINQMCKTLVCCGKPEHPRREHSNFTKKVPTDLIVIIKQQSHSPLQFQLRAVKSSWAHEVLTFCHSSSWHMQLPKGTADSGFSERQIKLNSIELIRSCWHPFCMSWTGTRVPKGVAVEIEWKVPYSGYGKYSAPLKSFTLLYCSLFAKIL